MLGKSSVFMMVLLVAALLVGISSTYTPANVETQPQPQPQIPGSKIILSPQPLTAQRALEDKQFQIQLVDRLMPEIIKRIDVKLVLTEKPSKIVYINHKGLYGDFITTDATCAPGETAVGAEYLSSAGDVWSLQRGEHGNPSKWSILTLADSSGAVSMSAMCLKVQLSLRPLTAHQPGSLGYLQEIPQPPAKPQPPSQPPGGPPLQPPPGFGK